MNSFKVTTLNMVTAAAIAFSGCGGSSSGDTASQTPAVANCDANFINEVYPQQSLRTQL